MDKIILNDGASIDIDSSGIVTSTNGLILTFANQTISDLETLMTKANLAVIKFAKSDGSIYAAYNNLGCLSISKMISSGNIVVTLYTENATEERITNLENQNSEMLLALVMGGLM